MAVLASADLPAFRIYSAHRLLFLNVHVSNYSSNRLVLMKCNIVVECIGEMRHTGMWLCHLSCSRESRRASVCLPQYSVCVCEQCALICGKFEAVCCACWWWNFSVKRSARVQCNCNTRTFFWYCSCIALVRTPAIQRCNTSFLQLAANLQATCSSCKKNSCCSCIALVRIALE